MAFAQQRLHAMREAAARLMARNRLGREVFARLNSSESFNVHNYEPEQNFCVSHTRDDFGAASSINFWSLDHEERSFWPIPPDHDRGHCDGDLPGHIDPDGVFTLGARM